LAVPDAKLHEEKRTEREKREGPPWRAAALQVVSFLCLDTFMMYYLFNIVAFVTMSSSMGGPISVCAGSYNLSYRYKCVAEGL